MKTPTIIFQHELVEKIPEHNPLNEGMWVKDVFVQEIEINDEIYKKMVCGGIIQIYLKPTPIKPAVWFDGEPSSIPNTTLPRVVWEVNFKALNKGYVRNVTDMIVKMYDQGEIVVRWEIETHKKCTQIGADHYFQDYKEVFYNLKDLKEWLKEPLFYSNGSPQFRHEIDMSKLENLE